MYILTKFCTKCETEKPNHDFAISKATKSGRRHRCTSCRNARRRELYKNPELKNWNKVWIFDKCKNEALKYTNRTDFVHYSPSAYHRALKDGFLDQICSHMTSRWKPFRFWTFEQCQKEALKYKTKAHLKRDNSSAYSISLRNGWIPFICSHMDAVGNQYKRLVYAYEFSNNVVYVGLTCNKELALNVQADNKTLVFANKKEGFPQEQLYVDIDEYEGNIHSKDWQVPQSLRLIEPEAVIKIKSK